jgi:hypothetical protein
LPGQTIQIGVISRKRESSVKTKNPSATVNSVLLKQAVESFPETFRQRNHFFVACDQQQEIANAIINSNAPSALSQMFFNHQSLLKRKLPVEVCGEFASDKLAADFDPHAPRFTLFTPIRSLMERYNDNSVLCVSV